MAVKLANEGLCKQSAFESLVIADVTEEECLSFLGVFKWVFKASDPGTRSQSPQQAKESQ